MNRKYLAFICLLAVLLLSISAAAAADDLNATMETSVDSDGENTDDILQEQGYTHPDLNMEAENILVGDECSISTNLSDNDGAIIDRPYNVSVYRVTAYDYEEILPAQTVTGSGTVTVAGLTNGTYFASAIFAGDANYAACRNSLYFVVKTQKETPRFDVLTDGYYTSDDMLDFSFHLYDSDNEFIPSSADVYLNGAYIETVRQIDEASPFEFYHEITQKTEYEVRLVFKGDRAFNPLNHTFTMKPREKRSYMYINIAPVVYGRDAVIEVEMQDEEGEILNHTFSITVTENDNPNGLNVTYQASGSKTITINASLLKSDGNYTVTAAYAGTSIYTPCNARSEFRAYSYLETEFQIDCEECTYYNDRIFRYALANETTIYYQLRDSDEGENLIQPVDIYLNGEHFTTVVTEDGQSEIRIGNLKVGMNTISFVFNGTGGYGPSNYTLNLPNYQKLSKIRSNIPYAVFGNNVTAYLELNDGENIICEDFTVTLHRYYMYDPLGPALANYTIRNGSGTIVIPADRFPEIGRYILKCSFEGNDIYSILSDGPVFWLNKEKQTVSIGVSCSRNVITDSVEYWLTVQAEGSDIASLVDIYIDGTYNSTINYTGGRYKSAIEGLHLGKNTVEFIINETYNRKRATYVANINYNLANTTVDLYTCGDVRADMERGVTLCFSVSYRSEDIRTGSAEVYANGEKYATLSLESNPYSDSGNIYFTFRPESPGEYNISVKYPGDGVSFNPSWSETRTVTIDYSDVNPNTTAVICNTNTTDEIRIGEYIRLAAYLKNGNDRNFSDYVDIYINGTRVTGIHSENCFTFTPSQEGVYNITAKYEGDHLYNPSDFSDSLIITVREASIPVTLEASMNNATFQGEILEVSYSLVSQDGAVPAGDESNYVEIFFNSAMIANTTALSGTFTVRLHKTYYNTIKLTVHSQDRKYDFANGKTWRTYEYSHYVQANPEGRVKTALTIQAKSGTVELMDTIVIYNNLTNMSELNYPGELNSLASGAKINIYLNGEKVGTASADINGESGYEFKLAKVNRTGWYNFTAVLEDGENIIGSSSNILAIYVEPMTTTISYTSTGSPYSLRAGENCILYFTMSAYGIGYIYEPIDIYINGVKNATVMSSRSSFRFEPKAPGQYNITAIYGGNAKYKPCEYTITTDVRKALPRISLSAGGSDIDVLSSCELNITLRNHLRFPATVEIYVNDIKNDTIIMNGSSCIYRFIPQTAGTFKVNARYVEDDYYASTTSYMVTVTASRLNSGISISSAKTRYQMDDDILINLDVLSNGTAVNKGTVEIYVNYVQRGSVDLSKNHTYKFMPYEAMSYSIYAKYLENDVYDRSESNTIVIDVEKVLSWMSISADREEFEMGSNSTISIAVEAHGNAVNTGIVSIYVDGKKNGTVDLSKGNTYTFQSNAIGTHDIYARYGGTNVYSYATSDTVQISVTRLHTSASISADKTEFEIGSDALISISVMGNGTVMNSGLVDICINGNKNDTVNLSETGSWLFAPAKAGTYAIHAYYTGNEQYSSVESDAIAFNVNRLPSSLSISSDRTTDEVGGSVEISVNLTSRGTALKDPVEIYVNGIRTDTVSTGTYRFAPNTFGNYSISVKYPGNDTYADCESNTLNITFNAKATTIVSANMQTTAIDTKADGKKGGYFTMTLKDTDGRALAGKLVEITFNKQTYKVQTDSKGIAKAQVNILNYGTYKVSVKYAGDGTYKASSASATIKVKKQKAKLTAKNKKFKSKAKTKKITATLKTSRGKAIKGKKLTFTIKGKKYTAKTNSKGIATVKVKLTKKGKYVCKIRYGGDKTYSAISKKVKITLK